MANVPVKELHFSLAPQTTKAGGESGIDSFGIVATSQLNNPDNTSGSGTVATSNQNSKLVVTGSTIHGRFDTFSVLNNPA